MAFFSFALAFGQENCDNGIDDDGDGLIDMNDLDCECGTNVISLFPNASFEEYSECPDDYTQLYKAVPWLQATDATTDFIHKCGFLPSAIVEAGLDDFPDGDGICAAIFSSAWREYVGTILTTPLLAGTTYQFTFDVAALTISASTGGATDMNPMAFETVDIALFGSPELVEFPLETPFSPDTFDDSWVALGTVSYTPVSSWSQVTILFTPLENINAVMFGPPQNVPASYNTFFYGQTTLPVAYFLYDSLQWNEAYLFGVNITQDGNFCDNSLVLTAHITDPLLTDVTFQWYRDGIAIAGETSATLNVPFDPANIAVFSVKMDYLNSCYSSNTITTNYFIPKIPVDVVQPDCSPTGTITISQPVATAEYSFDGGQTWQTGLSITLPPGDYYVKYRLPSGCISETNFVKLIADLVPAPTGSINQVFCSNSMPTISDLAASGPLIKWYAAATGGNPLPNSLSLVDGATYYATQTYDGCESLYRFAVTVAIIESLPANNLDEFVCDDSPGPEIVNLTQYNEALSTPASDYTFSYFLSYEAALENDASNQISNPLNYSLLEDTLFFVRIATPLNPCPAIAQLSLKISPLPQIQLADNLYLCKDQDISLDAGAGFDSYVWSTTETTRFITVSEPGNYSVTVTQNHASAICTSAKAITILPSAPPEILEVETIDWTDHDNTITVHLSNPTAGDYEFSIDGTNFQQSNVFTGLHPGIYTVFVNDRNDCGDASQETYVLHYPNFFTPNEDGYNDFWQVKFSYAEPGMVIRIYDRYGKFIKELSPLDVGWDGTYNNRYLPSTDYWFNVFRTDGRIYKGHFSMKR